MKILKKILETLIIISLMIMIIIVLTLIVKSKLYKDEIASFCGYTPFVVATGSMEPVLRVHDIIVTKKVQENELKIGDIISYHDKENNIVITHRIVRIEENNENKIFVMKGDNNNTEDKIKVSINNIQGKYVFSIPLIGKIAAFINTPSDLIIIITGIILIYIIIDIIGKLLKNRDLKGESAMLEGIKVLSHNCVRFEKSKIIYTDPFRLEKNYNDADIILITHSHYDHFSEEDIKKVMKEDTIICITADLYDKTIGLGFKKDNIIVVKPNKIYNLLDIEVRTILAYNTNKQFHPKENEWLGYIIKIDDIVYYIAGDTDITPENKIVKCDIAFVPVGGTYTTDSKEAADLINMIKPIIAVPVHYGVIVGADIDAEDFKKHLNKNIRFELCK